MSEERKRRNRINSGGYKTARKRPQEIINIFLNNLLNGSSQGTLVNDYLVVMNTYTQAAVFEFEKLNSERKEHLNKFIREHVLVPVSTHHLDDRLNALSCL